MNAIRRILLPLLIIPFGMLLYVFIYPDWQWESPGLEYLFLAIGLPILIVNFIAWFHPEIIRSYFPVSDDWGKGTGSPIAFAILASMLAAFSCVGMGGMTLVANARLRPTGAPPRVQAVTATAFARSVQILARSTEADVSAVVSTPRPSNEPPDMPEQSLQIPVSGGMPTGSPVPSVPAASAATSAASLALAQAGAAATATALAGTVIVPETCAPASSEYIDAIWDAVLGLDPDAEVETAWMAPSTAAPDLWFVAAPIFGIAGETEGTLPGVWALRPDAEGNLEIYAINAVAMEYSEAAWGEDHEPVLTMQSDGAQSTYTCAAGAP